MEKFVDVRRLIASKNPKLLKWLPGFIIRWVERVIHQEEVNDFFEKHEHDDVHSFCRSAIEEMDMDASIEGMENIPVPPQNVIFAANHPLGGMDAIAVIDLFREVRPDIKFIANDLLMAVKNLKSRFIGVNKVGKNAKESLQKVEEQFASGTATFIFPAGLVSRKIKGEIVDLTWKKTFITKARKYQLPIVPVHIGGRLTNRFYRLANFRKFLGIKFNIEMFFLVDELFRQRSMHIKVMVGKPISPETFTKEKTDEMWADWVKQKVYQLSKV